MLSDRIDAVERPVRGAEAALNKMVSMTVECRASRQRKREGMR
jgi:hypothetical protein